MDPTKSVKFSLNRSTLIQKNVKFSLNLSDAQQDDEDGWDTNHQSLIAAIEKGFAVNRDDIDSIMDPEGVDVDMDEPNELMDLWLELEEEHNSLHLTIVLKESMPQMSNPKSAVSPSDSAPATPTEPTKPTNPTVPASTSTDSHKHPPIVPTNVAKDAVKSTTSSSKSQAKGRFNAKQKSMGADIISMDIADHLTALGNGIGLLKGESKVRCGKLLRDYVDCTGEMERNMLVRESLQAILEDDTYVHVCCASKMRVAVVFDTCLVMC